MRIKIIITMIVTVFVIAACSQPANNDATELSLSELEESNSLTEEEYESEAEKASALVKAMNPEECSTIKDKNLAIYCNDEAYSRKAFAERDSSLCEPIIDELMENVCTKSLDSN